MIRPQAVAAPLIIATACAVAGAHTPDDYDLLSLRLANSARTNPQGQTIDFGETPVAPLAYDLMVGQAAEDHALWMSDNRANPAIQNPDWPTVELDWVPDTFTQYQTLDGQPGGTPATTTTGYTGVTVGDRLAAAGFAHTASGENLAVTQPPTPSTPAQNVMNQHDGWWNITADRATIMSDQFTAFGYHMTSDSDVTWGVRNYAKPSTGPAHYVLGLVFDDKDNSQVWEAHDTGSLDREGIGGQLVEFFHAGTMSSAGTTTTLGNGSFSMSIADGNYDVKIGSFTFEDVAVNGANVDLGDLIVGDFAGTSFTTAPIWGTTPVSSHRRFAATGTANLDGSLVVSFQNGFVPALTDEFEVLLADSINGTFSNIIRMGTYAGGVKSAVVYEADRVVIRAAQLGDTDLDGDIDAADIDNLYANFGSTASEFDVAQNGGAADQSDVDALVRDVLNTEYGDADLDGKVTLVDLDFIGNNWARSVGWGLGDFNGSGVVDLVDLDFIGTNFGFMATPPSAPAVPEPTAGVLLLLSVGVLARRRRIA